MKRMCFAIAVLFVLLLAGQVAAQDMEKQFKGKTINLVVGTSAGGGYDIIARIFARYAPKHLPGSPRFIVRNVPGGAGLKGTQYMNRSKPDGLTVGPHFTSLVMKELAGVDVPGFNVKDLIILGAPTLVDDNYLICADRNVVKSWEDMLKMGRAAAHGLPASRHRPGAHGRRIRAACGRSHEAHLRLQVHRRGVGSVRPGRDRGGDLPGAPLATHVPGACPEEAAATDLLVERAGQRHVAGAVGRWEAAQHPQAARPRDHRVPEGGIQHGHEHPPAPEGLHAAAQDAPSPSWTPGARRSRRPSRIPSS